MKIVTKKDFQDLYQDPGMEKTEEMRRTLAYLPVKETRKGRTVLSKPRLALILAIVMLFTGIAAVAMNNRTVWFNWGGQEVPEETLPAPEEEENWTEELNEQCWRLVEAVPMDLYATDDWLDGKGGTYRDIMEFVDTRERLLEIVDPADYPWLLKLLDTGDYMTATVFYGCAADGNYELVSKTVEGAFELEQYRVAPEKRVVTHLAVTVGDGEKFRTVDSEYQPSEEALFGYDMGENLKAEPMEVPGMEKAICIAFPEEGTHTINMYRRMEKPLTVRSRPLAFIEDYEGTPTETVDCGYELVSTYDMTPEEVLALFTETK